MILREKRFPARIFVQTNSRHLTTAGKKFGHLQRARIDDVPEKEKYRACTCPEKKTALVYERV